MADPLRVCKALADETRLRLVRLLGRGPLNVNEIIDILQMGQSRVSRHLKILSEAGLIGFRRQGTWIYYQVSRDTRDPLVDDMLDLLGRHEREVAYYAEDLQGLERVIEHRRERTRCFFDSITDPKVLQGGSDGQVQRQAVLDLVPPRCRRVLDLGVGAGLLLPELLERSQAVIAVDASRTMLDMARQTVGAYADRCDFRLGDLAHLPVADGEVDTVIACMVLHHVSHPWRALAEVRRALQSGGTLVIVDLLQHQDETMRERMADLWLGFAPEELRGWLQDLEFDVSAAGAAAGTDHHGLITLTGRKR